MTDYPMPESLDDYFNGLDSWTATDEESATHQRLIWIESTELVPISEFYGAQGRETALVCYDRAATYDFPGARSILALHVQRDLGLRQFTMRQERFPTVPLAEHWLAERGVPTGSLVTFDTMKRSADPLTGWSEERLRESPHRFELEDDYTNDDEVWVIFHDRDAGDLPPYLVQLETPDPGKHFDFQIRERRFDTFEEAREWTISRADSPAPTSELIPRSHAAVRISAFSRRAAQARSKRGSAPADHSTTPAPTARRSPAERRPGR